MMTVKTFKRMIKLSRILDQGDEGCNEHAHPKLVEQLAETSKKYDVVKVDEPDSNNYHFELRLKPEYNKNN